jgi:ATP-binding cassette subfamily B protein
MTSWVRMFRLLARVGWEIGPGVFLCYVGVNAMALIAPLLLAVGLRPLVDGVVSDRTGQVLTGAALTATGLVVSLLTPAGYRWATIRVRELSTMVIQRRLLTLATAATRVEHFERPEFWDRLQLLKRDA